MQMRRARGPVIAVSWEGGKWNKGQTAFTASICVYVSVYMEH